MNSTHDCLAQHKVDLAGTLALGKGIFVRASIPSPHPPIRALRLYPFMCSLWLLIAISIRRLEPHFGYKLMPYVRHLMPLFGQCHYAVDSGSRCGRAPFCRYAFMFSLSLFLSLSFCYSPLFSLFLMQLLHNLCTRKSPALSGL